MAICKHCQIMISFQLLLVCDSQNNLIQRKSSSLNNIKSDEIHIPDRHPKHCVSVCNIS